MTIQELYKYTIRSYSMAFEALGLPEVFADDYRIRFAGGANFVRLEWERNDWLSLSIAVADFAGVVREISLLEDVIDPEFAQAFRAKLASMEDEARSSEGLAFMTAVENFIKFSLDSLLHFLKVHFNEVFQMPAELASEYEERNRRRLRRFGIVS